MAGYRTHLTTSTLLGVGYGFTGYWVYDVRPATCLLGAGLCGLSGMLPDLDSDTGVALRESVAFGAAVVPMLLLDRFQEMGLTTDLMVLVGALIYIGIRFGLAETLRRYTVHRGMWHSVPAAMIAGLLAYLICIEPNAQTVNAYQRSIGESGNFDGLVNYGLFEKMFKVVAVVVGFMSHLLLDEFYSIEWYGGRFRLKRSFGTAIKFYSSSALANASTYGKLALLVAVTVWMTIYDSGSPSWQDLCETARHWIAGWRF